MTDTPNKDGSDNNNLDDKGKDSPQSSYEKLKVSHTKLEEKLTAQENAAAAERRKADDRIKALEAKNEEPKEDVDRIAALEVRLARSQAVSTHGLSVEDAGLLKGTPDEIEADAKYWAERLKDIKPDKVDDDKVDDNKDDLSNKQIIDAKINDQHGHPTPPPKPDPIKSNLSWIEQYKAAPPNERYKMDQRVLAGVDDPHK